ncbi:MAG: SH3 domain-containing protein, partial [Armatimonadetes bacterium]|nr:SH3 domain-containing protein [Anaerolineae bacterium]
MKARIVIFGIILSTFLALTVNVSAQVADLQTSNNIAVNVRSGPGVEWRLLGYANPGTTIRLDGQAFGGSWVRGITSTGLTGWMLAEYLSISAEQAASLRGIWVEEPFTLSAPEQVGGVSTGGSTFGVTTIVNLRSGPGTQWRLVGQVNPGEALNVDGKSAGGNWVRGINVRGQVGWAFAQYVTGGAVASLPVVSQDSPFGLGAPTGGAPAAAAPTTAAPDAPIAPPAPPINTGAPITGFNLGGHIQNANDTTLNWMRTAGMSWIKKQWRWERGQDPASAAGIIQEAHANGFRILLGVVGNANQVNDG